MYVPEMFQLNDREAAFALMRQFDFALLVTAAGGAPVATHLPFMLDADRGPNGTLLAHMARANPHWKDFAAMKTDALVIFQGSHAYVSPSWYGHDGKAVPTWNYMAVHAYGRPRILDDPATVRPLLDRLVAVQESGRAAPWSLAGQEESYLDAMMRGIVAFEIEIDRLDAKAKLSQNKSPEERAGVIAALETAEDPLAMAVASEMRARAD